MSNTLPFLLQTTEQALAYGNRLLLPSPELSPEMRRAATPVAIERTLLAFHIPHLPDFLTSPHLIGHTERDRLAEILDHQGRFIANLGKWKGTAFALRYRFDPERHTVDMMVLARGLARGGHGQQLGERISDDLATLLRANQLAVDPVVDQAILRDALQPFPRAVLFEIRQRETVLSLTRGDAYVVYPFRPTLSTWLSIFSTLTGQSAACVINIYLEPTQLFPEEQQAFAEAASIAETLADFTFEGLAYHSRISDPQARIVARLYTHYLQRLTDPFILVAQVASPDVATARSVAQTLGSEITETTDLTQSMGENAPLPSGIDVITPRTEDEMQAAWRTMAALDSPLWGPTEASPGKERLRFLMDARGASAAFRFPIPARGGIPGVRTQQILPGYELGERRDEIGPEEIVLGDLTGQGGLAAVPVAAFNRHVLIAGTTGSGKTTTCMHILSELWKKGIPFLVIDPAKSEYRALLDSPMGKDLQIFTLGDESVSPFRMNPLEILPGVTVESHISALRANFEAALPTFGILPSLIEESLDNVYVNKGWDLADRGRADDRRVMPMVGELYSEIIGVTEKRGYSDKTVQDIRAAASGRIGSLLRGSKGRMLNTRRSIPMAVLMTRPTLLELDHLNDEEKALVTLFFLTRLREYSHAFRSTSQLAHVTVIEEAHRLAAASVHQADREIMADTRATGAESLSMTLSEIRAYGEGLILAEQIPSRLVADALKNTNIKIVHRLPGQDDREAIGGTMNLGAEQEPYLAKLAPGQAAFFTEGLEKPTFVSVPNYRLIHHLPERVADERVEQKMAPLRQEDAALLLPFDGCRFCKRPCQYRDRVTQVAFGAEANKKFKQALFAYEREMSKQEEAAAWNTLSQHCTEALRTTGLSHDEHAAYCLFVHLWRGPVNAAAADRLRAAVRGAEA